MNLIFLDCDGVINNKQHILATKKFKTPPADTLVDADLFAMKRDVAPQNMWVLGFILDQLPDLKIVISSAWRLHYDIKSFKELFKIFRLDETRIIGFTPKKFSSERVHEINEWLDDHDGVTDWVVLDDHVVFNIEDPDKEREFLTDSWVGLTMHDAFKIIKHFKPEFKQPEINI